MFLIISEIYLFLFRTHVNLPFKTVYSFTAIPNKRSERVMQKIGMHFEKEFDHPLVEQGHWLCRHILYKIEI